MKTLILSIFFFILYMNLQAQNAIVYNSKNTPIIDDGLDKITADFDGNVWFTIQGFGLTKYDGKEFVNFGQNHPIIGTSISFLFTDSKGCIWLHSNRPTNKLTVFDGSSWKIITEKEVGVSEISASSITEDKNGNIYIGGYNQLLKFDGQKWFKIEFPYKNLNISLIDINEKESIAIVTNKGLFIRNNNTWKKITKENSELRLSTIKAIKYVNEKLIIGYGGGHGDGGFSILHNNNWSHYNKYNSSIPDHMIRDIEIDNNGLIWMATNNGLIKMKDKTPKSIFIREGTFKNTIFDIAVGKQKIWVTTNFGLIEIEN